MRNIVREMPWFGAALLLSVQVTHSMANAACSTRTIDLQDGCVTSDTAGVVENAEVRG